MSVEKSVKHRQYAILHGLQCLVNHARNRFSFITQCLSVEESENWDMSKWSQLSQFSSPSPSILAVPFSSFHFIGVSHFVVHFNSVQQSQFPLKSLAQKYNSKKQKREFNHAVLTSIFLGTSSHLTVLFYSLFGHTHGSCYERICRIYIWHVWGCVCENWNDGSVQYISIK